MIINRLTKLINNLLNKNGFDGKLRNCVKFGSCSEGNVLSN